jgi:hypothetical protein
MKKLISIVLLILFSFDFAGYFLLFSVLRSLIRYSVKEQIKRDLPSNELTCIIVNCGNEIEWKEKNEFRYRGELFDVVKSVKNADGTTGYYCLADKEETQLFRKNEELIELKLNNNENTQQGKIVLIHLSKLIFPVNFHVFRILLNPFGIKCYSIPNLYKSFLSDVDLPPPKNR